MQDIDPNQNMDELYRSAAENYPLRSPGNEWGDIASLVISMPVTTARYDYKRKRSPVIVLTSLVLLIAYSAPDYLNKLASEQENVSAIQPSRAEQKKSIAVNQPKNNAVSLFNEQLMSTKELLPDEEMNLSATSVAGTNREQSIAVSATGIPGHFFPLKKTPAPLQPKAWYWGIAAGPQFNEVRRQGMQKAGFDVGITAGYRFSKRFSVETGLFFSQKYYHSDGKYFDMKKVSAAMPAGMQLVTVEGKSTVVELPIQLQYRIAKNKEWFVSAGISNYLLTKENNEYNAMVNGAMEKMSGTYGHAIRYAAAAISLGAGYTLPVNNRTGIRLEPYIQIPIQGIGVGDMPVTSTGIHIGIIHFSR